MRYSYMRRPGKYWLRTIIFLLVFGCSHGLSQDAASQKATEAGSQGQTSQEKSATSSPNLTDAEKEDFLLKAKVVSMRNINTGVTGTRRAVLDDGKLKHDAHIQTVDISKTSFQTDRGTEFNFRDSYKFNIAAYELDKLLDLNMVPPHVERKVVGHMSSVGWWLDDSMMEGDRKKRKMEPPDVHFWNLQMYVVRVFDQLVYNMDSNLGNLMITKDWKIWKVDHTRAFRTMKDLKSPKDLVQCDRKLLGKLRELNKDTLKEKLGHYLTNSEIEGLLARRDKIVKFFDDQVAQKGEAAVLYDLDRK